jgi:polyisoprenoid-binding protein YceI
MAALFLPMPVLLFSTIAWSASVTVDVNLSPAGSFKGKTSDIKGFVTKKGDEVSARNIVVNLKNFKTGIELRDKHTLKHLETDKYPEAILISATGKKGKGAGKIRIRGIEKEITGTYKINNNELLADFKLNLADFKITNVKYMGAGVDDEVVLHIAVPIKGP